MKKDTKKKIAAFINSKGGKGTIIGTTLFLLTGILAIVLGYAIRDGWASVLAWFTSRWAAYIYVFIGLYIIVLLNIIYISKRWED